MGRAPCCDKANVKKGPWSPEEDAKLKAYIEQYGTGGNWIALPQKIGLKRCGKSCRLRWLNYLRPNIKHGGFSEEEDNIICNLYISIGSRWSIIAAQLPGRTDNDIKNYWNTRLKKKLLGRRKQSSLNRLSSANLDQNGVEESSPSSQGLSNSALERLHLHMQLQSMQNPLSFYNNPALWPKLHPAQEKMILQSLSERSNNPLLQHFQLPCPNQQVLPGNSVALQQDYPKFDEGSKAECQESTLNAIPSSDSTSAPFLDGNNNSVVQKTSDVVVNPSGIEQVSALQSEIEDFLNNKINGFMGTPVDQNVSEFDCFKEINGSSKESLIWWSNEFDHHQIKTASSNSWDSNSVLQSEGMFQDYELSYNMQHNMRNYT